MNREFFFPFSNPKKNKAIYVFSFEGAKKKINEITFLMPNILGTCVLKVCTRLNKCVEIIRS